MHGALMKSMTQIPLNDPDKEFCHQLYVNLYPLLLKRVTAILHDDDVARDIVQETFVALFGKTAKLRGMTLQQQAAYAVTAAKNNALKYLKKYRSRDALIVLGQTANVVDKPATAADDPLEVTLRKVSQEELWTILNDGGLAKKDQRILRLTYMYNLSDRDSAAQMGMKYATFRKDKSRARAKALELLQGRMPNE